MEDTWYCTDCERYIDADEISTHEDDGHEVTGRIEPDRLLAQDPVADLDRPPGAE